MFCPKCGSILVPKEGRVLCSCGYEKKAEKMEVKEKINTKEVNVTEEIEIYPLVDEECPQCGHAKSYFWEVQTRASDEPATKFFKCEKCKHIWRDYK